MAELRLIVALAMMTGCRCGSESKQAPASGPALHSNLAPPAGWQALPSLAAAARQTTADIAGSEAWGDPARGCYATWIALHGGGGALDKIADQLVKSLGAKATVRDVAKPAPNILTASFEHGDYHGKLHAQLATSGDLTALACFWNPREPAACEAACVKLLGSMR